MSLSERALRRQWGEEDAADVRRQYERRPLPAGPVDADLFPSRYHCVQCRHETDGRFTKHKLASGGGWDQGHQQPHWYCWTCLPKGKGRGEEEP